MSSDYYGSPCCTDAVLDDQAGWWCPVHGDEMQTRLDETYAELRAEHLAAADLDPDWPGHAD